MEKSKVLIMYTGGTIGMAPKDPNNPASPLVPKSFKELRKYMPSMDVFHENIEFGEISPFGDGLDSSDVNPRHWIEMAKNIYNVYNDYDGFIILHGTDTMAYTASGLSFIFNNLSKPIIITGSQLQISHPRTDAVSNFTNAIYLAAYRTFKLHKIPEVIICFANKILRGNRTTKVSSSQLQGFHSPNYPELGTLGEHIKINTGICLNPPPADIHCTINQDMVENIMNIIIFPGFGENHFNKLIRYNGIEGIIINTFGAGNVPNDIKLLNAIEKATSEGKIILNITQCLEGMVEMGLYAASSGLLERGVVSGLDMTTEAAMAKMMWTLGTQVGPERITQLQINQRGEQTENLFDLRYGEIKKNDAVSIHTAVVGPDPRLDTEKLSKAVIRFSNMRIIGARIGETIKLKIFMNKPLADHSTLESDDKCVTSMDFVWGNKPVTLIKEITEKSIHVIGKGVIALTIISPNEDVKFYYTGLYLAIFSKA